MSGTFDRYITEDVIDALVKAGADTESGAEEGLRAALPGILAQHRADVLREAADEIHGRNEPSDIAASALRRMANEAVAQ